MSNLLEWIEAISALATMLLAIIIFIQNKKIKTLTDVVTSLNEQKEVHEKILSFEIRSRLNNVQPNFITGGHIKQLDNSFLFSLKNVGQRARNFRLSPINNIELVKGVQKDNSAIGHFDLKEAIYKPINKDLDCSFKIIYEDDYDNSFYQIVRRKNNRLIINLPDVEDINEK